MIYSLNWVLLIYFIKELESRYIDYCTKILFLIISVVLGCTPPFIIYETIFIFQFPDTQARNKLSKMTFYIYSYFLTFESIICSKNLAQHVSRADCKHIFFFYKFIY